ncbi:MAG: hypothetical protein KBG21_01090 [Ignavibacteria bacterium]|nr:hypothetical protein [Ignavibacteria bacterium]
MEIIFTLILLIGIGINSHRYDARNQEVPKQEVTSFIEEETSSTSNQLKVLSNTESEIDIDINNELSEVIQKSEKRKMESKGKYISVRINDGNN